MHAAAERCSRVCHGRCCDDTAQHQQGDQHRHPSGFLAAILVPTDLMGAEAQSRLAFPMQHLHGPALLVDTHDWARRQRGQIGHQDFRLFEAQVSPSFTPYHSDITHMTQPQASVRRPKGPAASASSLSGNPCALVILMRHRTPAAERLLPPARARGRALPRLSGTREGGTRMMTAS